MLTIAQKKRKRKEHIKLTEEIKKQELLQQELVINKEQTLRALLNGEEPQLPVYVCEDCGYRAYSKDTIEHSCRLYLKKPIVVCKCCGGTAGFADSNTYVCNRCLGRSVDLFGSQMVIKEWAKSPISFTITKLDGSESSYSSLREASEDLGYSIPALRNLVLSDGNCGGLKATVIPNVKTWEDYEAYKNSKKLKGAIEHGE